MLKIPIEEAAGRLAELIEKARLGTEIVLTQDGHPAAKLAPLPYPPLTEPRPFGSAKGLLTVPDDFDEPLEEFAEYM